MLTLTLIRASDKEESRRVNQQLEETERDIVDMAARLARLEAEVGIYRPLFTDDEDKAST